jgi:hypothetical protein
LMQRRGDRPANDQGGAQCDNHADAQRPA